MTNKERETPTWNPPEPPWNPEPNELSLKPPPPNPSPESEPQPVNMGLEDKIEEMVESGELEIEGTDDEVADPPAINSTGLKEYTVKCPTGITVNGKIYEGGPHAVGEGIYETLSALDAPYQ